MYRPGREQDLQTAFLIATSAWVLWWNLQWRWAIKLYGPLARADWGRKVLRIWFALCFLGVALTLIQDLSRSAPAGRDVAFICGIALLVCTMVALLTAFILWMGKQLEYRKESERHKRKGS